jgi:hypothetical protein
MLLTFVSKSLGNYSQNPNMRVWFQVVTGITLTVVPVAVGLPFLATTKREKE